MYRSCLLDNNRRLPLRCRSATSPIARYLVCNLNTVILCLATAYSVTGANQHELYPGCWGLPWHAGWHACHIMNTFCNIYLWHGKTHSLTNKHKVYYKSLWILKITPSIQITPLQLIPYPVISNLGYLKYKIIKIISKICMYHNLFCQVYDIYLPVNRFCPGK